VPGDRIEVPTAADMRELGRRLGAVLRAGDLVVLSGPLGAGKTTLVQGIGDGMAVRGPVTSPTFVIARVHPALAGGPGLVHVDAYRLGSVAEVDDLDLDASLDDCVTVVEWGEGLVEGLAADRLDVSIEMSPAAADRDWRTVAMTGIGQRWESVAESMRCGLPVTPKAI
jgi:tRNA threonylcarbamoyladenosine biosynthesis protein TsaE